MNLKDSYPLHSYSENFHLYDHFSDLKYPELIWGERSQAALTAHKVMAEAQAKSRLRLAIKHQSLKMQSYTYSSKDKTLVWREKIVSDRIGE